MLSWLGASLLAPMLATAAASGVRIDAVAQRSGRIEIVGVWPNSCIPQVQAQTSDDSGLDVLLADSGNICVQRERKFSVSIEPQDGFSPAPAVDTVRPLHLFAAAGNASRPALVGFRLLGGANYSIRPDIGFWWPDEHAIGAGSVLSIEVQDQSLGVALMSYDDASGDPIWYFGTTELSGRVAHVELTRMQYGASPFDAAQARPQPHPALAIDLHFLSTTRAQAWISRSQNGPPGIELVRMQFSRVPFSNLPQAQDWLGPWLLASSPSAHMESELPRTLVWVESIVLDENRVRLLDQSGTYALDCRHTGTSEDSPAQQCVLRDRDNTVLARFAEVGLQRLDGVRADGSPVILVRAH